MDRKKSEDRSVLCSFRLMPPPHVFCFPEMGGVKDVSAGRHTGANTVAAHYR